MAKPKQGPEHPREVLASSFASISRQLYSARTVHETLQRITTLSVATIDGCTGAGISFLQGDEVMTPVWTEPLVLQVDHMQYETKEGPCLDAISSGGMFYAEDLANDPRWPHFGRLAAEAGMGSLLSYSLQVERAIGALNLYSTLINAFDDVDQANGVIFASHAGVALAAAIELQDVKDALAVEIAKLDNLQGALASRQIIGRAEGILMNSEHVTSDEAFDILRTASQHLNTKLRDVAQYVVDTGEIPGSPDA